MASAADATWRHSNSRLGGRRDRAIFSDPSNAATAYDGMVIPEAEDPRRNVADWDRRPSLVSGGGGAGAKQTDQALTLIDPSMRPRFIAVPLQERSVVWRGALVREQLLHGGSCS
jgi:hypothetical protein